ncbi:MAG: signal peptidase I [Campylobacterota bacterium]
MEKLKKLYRFSNSWTGTIIIVLLVIFFVIQAFVIPSGSMKRSLLIGDHLFVKKFTYGIPVPHLPWIEIPLLPDFNGNGHLFEGEKPKRGDIVVFRYPVAPKIHYVKRNVAIGGDELLYTEDALYLRPHEGDTYIKQNYPQKKLITIGKKLWVKDPYRDNFPNIQYIGVEGGKDMSAFMIMARAALQDNLDMQPTYIKELGDPYGPGFNAFYKKVEKDRFYMVGDNRDNSNDSRFWGSVAYKHIVGQPWFVYFSWDDNYSIRWDRIGSSVEALQSQVYERN